jgi:hypothetical protein
MLSIERQNEILGLILKDRTKKSLQKEGADTLDSQNIKTEIGRFSADHGLPKEEVLETVKPIIEKAVAEFMAETAIELDNSLSLMKFSKK